MYANILNQIREGKIKRKSHNILLQYVGKAYSTDLVVEPTKLFPTKNKVESINISKLESLDGEEKEYSMKYVTDLEVSKIRQTTKTFIQRKGNTDRIELFS